MRQRITTPLFVAIGGLIDIGGTLRFKRKMPVAQGRQQDIDNINADGRRAMCKMGITKPGVAPHCDEHQ